MTTGSPTAVGSAPGDGPHLTLNDLHNDLVELRRRLPAAEESDELQALTRTLKRRQKIAVPLMWVVGIVGTVFSAGMAWAVFVGENATESEVGTMLEAAMESHNGAPAEDGPHPEMAKTLEDHGEAIGELKKQTEALGTTQGKLDKRSLYQFEFSRWQAKVIECERNPRCRKPPGKPKKVEDLESELMND